MNLDDPANWGDWVSEPEPDKPPTAFERFCASLPSGGDIVFFVVLCLWWFFAFACLVTL